MARWAWSISGLRFCCSSPPGLIQQWPGLGGHYPAVAYQTAFALNLVLEVLAIAWFVLPDFRERVSAFGGEVLGHSVPYAKRQSAASVYDSALHIWAARTIVGRLESLHWQVAAFGMIYPRCRLNHAMHASQ